LNNKTTKRNAIFYKYLIKRNIAPQDPQSARSIATLRTCMILSTVVLIFHWLLVLFENLCAVLFCC